MAQPKNNKATTSGEMGSVFSLLRKSADIVQKNWQAFTLVNILAILTAVGQAFGKNEKMENEWYYDTGSQLSGLGGGELAGLLGIGAVAVLLLFVIGVFLFAMATSLEVKSSAGKKPTISELFEDGKKYFFRIIGVVVLAGLIILGGFILLIIPGVFALGRLIMSPYHLVDKDTGVIEAIKHSNNQAKGKMWPIYAAILLTIGVSFVAGIIGAIPVIGPLIGVVVTVAYSLILALRYQQLKGKKV